MTPIEILNVVYYLVAGLVSIISIIITIVKLHKAKKKVKDAEQIAEIDKELELKAVELIGEAEAFYKNLDNVLKTTTGESAGVFKKDSVMSKLQTYALSIVNSFDYDYWSKKIDELVSFTKQVNSK